MFPVHFPFSLSSTSVRKSQFGANVSSTPDTCESPFKHSETEGEEGHRKSVQGYCRPSVAGSLLGFDYFASVSFDGSVLFMVRNTDFLLMTQTFFLST